MAKHERRTPLLRLLARLGWQRDPDLWTIPCRDGQGHRASLWVTLTSTGVSLTVSSPGPWALQPLHVGQLRRALRDALITVDSLAGPADHERPYPPETHGAETGGIPEPRCRTRLDHRESPSSTGALPQAANHAETRLEVNDDHANTRHSHSHSRADIAA